MKNAIYRVSLKIGTGARTTFFGFFARMEGNRGALWVTNPNHAKLFKSRSAAEATAKKLRKFGGTVTVSTDTTTSNPRGLKPYRSEVMAARKRLLAKAKGDPKKVAALKRRFKAADR